MSAFSENKAAKCQTDIFLLAALKSFNQSSFNKGIRKFVLKVDLIKNRFFMDRLKTELVSDSNVKELLVFALIAWFQHSLHLPGPLHA